MIDGIWQSCYTNSAKISDGVVAGAGWGFVAQSSGLTSDAVKGVGTIQGKNSKMSGVELDETGKILDLYELDMDESHMYVTRTRYGYIDADGERVPFRDAANRPNMFSHTYIFPWSEELVADINPVLTIADENFKTSEEEALQEQVSLILTEPFRIQDALQNLGLTAEKYLTLIKCVCVILSKKVWDNYAVEVPLYIQYDGTEQQLKELIYCIYKGIPHYMRKQLSFASCKTQNTDTKHFIFSIHAEKQPLYVNPFTGQNNVLTEEYESCLYQNRYMTLAVESAQDFDTWNGEGIFNWLDAEARQLGDQEASNPSVFQLIILMNQKITSQTTPSELLLRLSRFMAVPNADVPKINESIVTLMNEIINRNLNLPERMEGALEVLLNRNKDEGVQAVVHDYIIKRFCAKTAEEAAEELAGFSKDKFRNYNKMLMENPKGQEILAKYYLEYRMKQIETWAELDDITDELQGLLNSCEIRYELLKKAKVIYKAQMAVSLDIKQYKRYIKYVMQFVDGETIGTIKNEAKNIYWETMTLKCFLEGNEEVYYKMQVDSEACAIYMDYLELLRKYNGHNDKVYLAEVQKYFSEHKQIYIDPVRRKEACEYLITQIVVPDEERKELLKNGINVVTKLGMRSVVPFILVYEQLVNIEKGLWDSYDELIKNYEVLIEQIKIENQDYADELLNEINGMVITVYHKVDTTTMPVPIDAWLVVAGTQYKNVFEIFDRELPKILLDEELDYVAESNLLKRATYSRQAEDYIAKKTEFSKTLKLWMNEVKKSAKAIRSAKIDRQNEKYKEIGIEVPVETEKEPISEESIKEQVPKKPERKSEFRIQEELGVTEIPISGWNIDEITAKVDAKTVKEKRTKDTGLKGAFKNFFGKKN